MGLDMTDRGLAFPKGATKASIKGRADRAESKVKQHVRADVAERDGDCRLRHAGLGVCGGESQWAHLEDKRRARTRGMPPEIRHTTQDTAMLCTVHHRRYDAGEIAATFHTPERADGPMTWDMTWHTRACRYQEARRCVESCARAGAS